MGKIIDSFLQGRSDLRASRAVLMESVKAGFNGTSTHMAGNVSTAANLAGRAAGFTGGVLNKGLQRVAYGLGRTGPLMGLTGAIVGVGALAAGAYLAMTPGKKRGKEFSEDDISLAPIPPMLTPQDLVLQSSVPPELAGPADGRDPYHFRNTVNAGRGRAPEQATQPQLSAIDPGSVRDLGAPKTTQSV